MWQIIRRQKTKYIIENINDVRIQLVCFASDSSQSVLYWRWENMKASLDSLEKELKTSGSQHMNHNNNLLYKFKSKQYEEAAEMFIYLNLCPKFMIDWKQLYIDLIQNASPDMIVQTLNRLLITSRLRHDQTIVDISKAILKKNH